MKSMKSMMVAALVVGSLVACTTATFAQAAGGAGGGGRRGGGAVTSDALIARFQTALGETNKLTDAEIPQVKTVLDDMIKKQADLRADTTTAAADKRTKRMAIITDAGTALKAIVTPDQFTVIQPLLQRAGGGRRGGGAGGGNGGGAPPAAAPPQA